MHTFLPFVTAAALVVMTAALAPGTTIAPGAQAPAPSGPQRPIDPADASSMPRISLDAFKKAHAEHRIFVVDVRHPFGYLSGHIPGAINVPVDEVARLAADVRARAGDRLVVTYCSCPAEHLSADAAAELFKHGVKNVAALVGGYTEWVAKGGQVER